MRPDPFSPLLLLAALAGPLSAGHAQDATASMAAGPPDGPLRNTVPLPASRVAVEALTEGDLAWEKARSADPADRQGLWTAAFDAWHEALVETKEGSGVPLTLQDVPSGLFPDPDQTHRRRAEGIAIALQRRLNAASPVAQRAWIDRFAGAARASLAAARRQARASEGFQTAAAAFGRIEREFPGTDAAARAALARFDLAMEEGRGSAAALWLDRAGGHLALARSAGGWPEELFGTVDRAIQRRAATRPGKGAPRRLDASWSHIVAPEPPTQTSTTTPPRLVTSHVISGIMRSSDEPFGRGLESGVAFFDDGAALIQGAHGVLFMEPTGENGDPSRRTQSRIDHFLGIQRPVVRVSPSAGGWASLPASDGERVALVVGRAERPRNFGGVAVPPTGNVLAMIERGAADRPLDPAWVMQDGIVVRDPESRPRRTETNREVRRRREIEALTTPQDGGLADGWELGRGWEFQPGPVLADGRVFALARGLGDATNEELDTADVVVLLALDATTGDVIWSRVLTNERGLQDPNRRGDAGYFAATTMPLALDRATGTLLVGTNVGLAAAFGVADGRLIWELRTQRRSADGLTDGSFGGWPGSRAPFVVRSAPGAPATAWFAPFDSDHAYALPVGLPPADGSLFREPPRRRAGAMDLALVLPAAEGSEDASTLVMSGRDGRHTAVLVEGPTSVRTPVTYLAPDERLMGRAAFGGRRLFISGSHELSVLDRATGLSLITASPLPDLGVGRGGNVFVFGRYVYVVGRDTAWIFEPE